MLTLLLEQGVITEELTDMLITWNHNSGFNVYTKGRINGAEGEGELIDSLTGEVVVAVTESQKGERGFNGMTTYDNAENVIDRWAKN